MWAFALFDYRTRDAVLAGFLFYLADMLGHPFGRAFGFDLGGCCVQLTFSFKYCFGFDSFCQVPSGVDLSADSKMLKYVTRLV